MSGMPRTAEEAHREARRWYGQMLEHAAAGNVNLTGTAAACFQNACALAQMYELRNIRLAVMQSGAPAQAAPVQDPQSPPYASPMAYRAVPVGERGWSR